MLKIIEWKIKIEQNKKAKLIKNSKRALIRRKKSNSTYFVNWSDSIFPLSNFQYCCAPLVMAHGWHNTIQNYMKTYYRRRT